MSSSSLCFACQSSSQASLLTGPGVDMSGVVSGGPDRHGVRGQRARHRVRYVTSSALLILSSPFRNKRMSCFGSQVLQTILTDEPTVAALCLTGSYLALPIMRSRWHEDLTEGEARALLEDSLRVLFYRDCRALNRIQIAKVRAGGSGRTAQGAVYDKEVKARRLRFDGPWCLRGRPRRRVC